MARRPFDKSILTIRRCPVCRAERLIASGRFLAHYRFNSPLTCPGSGKRAPTNTGKIS